MTYCLYTWFWPVMSFWLCFSRKNDLKNTCIQQDVKKGTQVTGWAKMLIAEGPCPRILNIKQPGKHISKPWRRFMQIPAGNRRPKLRDEFWFAGSCFRRSLSWASTPKFPISTCVFSFSVDLRLNEHDVRTWQCSRYCTICTICCCFRLLNCITVFACFYRETHFGTKT